MTDIVEREFGVSVKNLIDDEDPVVIKAIEDFLNGKVNLEEFKRLVFARAKEVNGTNKLIEDYDRAMGVV